MNFIYYLCNRRFKSNTMNKKLLLALQDKCKDFGLSRAAIEDLAKSGSEGITDDTSDEDISKKADSLSVFAKLMQAEITRKSQKADPITKPQQQTTVGGNGGGAGEPKTGDDEPAWFKAFKAENDKKLSELQAENNSLKTEKAKAERLSLINSTAAKLGIPSTLMKHFALADDADVEKEMTAFKQELVTDRLMPADEASITSSSEQAAKDDAEAWAKSL